MYWNRVLGCRPVADADSPTICEQSHQLLQVKPVRQLISDQPPENGRAIGKGECRHVCYQVCQEHIGLVPEEDSIVLVHDLIEK